jgi:phosphoribosyl 1,2-cyclic phosphate phosphodiesterase
MRVTILGCGAAGGVPSLGHGWGRCDPAEPKNRRTRSSILVEEGGTALLVDTSPDLRDQMLRVETRHLDGVLYTHEHADHLHGIDDLREINRAMQAPIPVWAMADVLEGIQRRFGYVLEPLAEGATNYYKPVLTPNPIVGPFRVGGIPVIPFDQDHGFCRTTGFRFGPLAYSTDVVALPEDSFAALAGIEVWIVGCLSDTPHPTHAHVDKALEWIARIGPRRAYLTHLSPRLDYRALAERLPPHVRPAHDGLTIEVETSA